MREGEAEGGGGPRSAEASKQSHHDATGYGGGTPSARLTLRGAVQKVGRCAHPVRWRPAFLEQRQNPCLAAAPAWENGARPPVGKSSRHPVLLVGVVEHQLAGGPSCGPTVSYFGFF